jgi:hypothetical protein
MIRRLSTFLSVLSFVLGLAAGGLWMRSQTYHDAVSFVDWAHGNWSVGSRVEGFRIWHFAPWPVAEGPALRSYLRGSNPLLLQLNTLSTVPWRWFGVEGIAGSATVPLSNATGMPVWAHADEPFDWSTCHTSPVVTYWSVTIPQWQVVVAFGLLTVLMFAARQWQVRRLILILLTASSLGLCLGTCTLWIMSYGSAQLLNFDHEGVLWSMIASQGNFTIENTAGLADQEKKYDSTYENLKKTNDRDNGRLSEIASELDQHPPEEIKQALEQEAHRLDMEMKAITKEMINLQTPAPESHSVHLAIPAAIFSILPLMVSGMSRSLQQVGLLSEFAYAVLPW